MAVTLSPKNSARFFSKCAGRCGTRICGAREVPKGWGRPDHRRQNVKNYKNYTFLKGIELSVVMLGLVV